MQSIATLSLLALLATALTGPRAGATLGEKEASIERDWRAISGARHAAVVAHGKYTVHEIASSRMTVREYVSSDGVVFGLHWHGAGHPDLASLLGTHLEEFKHALRRSRRKRLGRSSHMLVQGSDLVVEKSGHMRAMQGRAYIPSLLPTGVKANDIQ